MYSSEASRLGQQQDAEHPLHLTKTELVSLVSLSGSLRNTKEFVRKAEHLAMAKPCPVLGRIHTSTQAP